MIKLYNNSKFYVLAPAGVATGGVELAHQLVDAINKRDREAYIVYVKDGVEFINAPVTKEYSSYDIHTAADIDDDGRNIIVLPEIYSRFIPRIKNAQICFWWMSVDNYLKGAGAMGYFHLVTRLHNRDSWVRTAFTLASKIIRRSDSYVSLSAMRQNARITHLYQSDYAKCFLFSHGITNTLPMRDYISRNIRTIKPAEERRNVILYNPKKGMFFTKFIQKNLCKYEFKPLVNMTKSEIDNAFGSAKVYIDFGNHPGQDRLPREAAMGGCCILTSKNGSANFFEDVPIDDKYKFLRKRSSINDIVRLVESIMEDYNTHSRDFDAYRRYISMQPTIFEQDVNRLLAF
mgnify:CR=1 FL=1